MINLRNIYYMLSYAFTALRKDEFRNCGSESFDNIYDLLSAILVTGLQYQLRRGASRNYKEVTEELRTVKGRIEIGEVIRTQSMQRGYMVCTHDEFSVDEKRNRIIKATLILLLKTDIPKTRRKEIRNILPFFAEVADIDIYKVDWNIRYGRNDSTYRMLIEICRLIVHGLIQNHDGKTVMLDFLDERAMCTLYEKFILEYYRKEHPELKANASMIPWDVEGDDLTYLPTMNTDITLEYGNKVLIIDAKYYAQIYGSYYSKKSWHSGNIYQIYTYVKNRKATVEEGVDVSGMLLYAGTDEDVVPQSYKMGGDTISINVLDLSGDFRVIRKTLDEIADKLEDDDYSDVLDFIDVFDEVALNGFANVKPHNIVPLFEEAISQLVRDDTNLVHYRDILAEYGIEWSSRSMADYDVSKADERCLNALLVGLFRGDHFANGTMERFIREGIVSRWLERLKQVM